MLQIKNYFSKKGLILIFFLSVLTISTYFFFAKDYRLAFVDGISMEPTYEHKDNLIYQKKTSQTENWKPYRNCLVVVKLNDQNLIKRIIGLPGETIEIKDRYIHINSKKLKDKFSHLRISMMLVDPTGKPMRDWESEKIVYEYTNKGPITLLQNQYWVIGDNRSVSWYGTISIKNIRGIIIWQV